MSLFLTLLTVCLFSASDVSASVPVADNQSSYQTAFLYFLPDYEPKEQTEAEVRGCAKIGYTVTRSNCAAPRILKDKCPVGNSYKTCYCAGSPTCTGSTSSSNPYPSSTGASSSSCMNCAGSTLYSWSCSSSTCSSYCLSSCPSNGYCSRCCDGYYKLNSCASGYSISGNSCVKDCVPMSSETGCSYGTYSCSNGCGGTRTCCSAAPACTPLSSETGCSYGTESCSDGCGGTRTCCSAAPATSTPTDPCSGVTCSSGYTCSNGTCVNPCDSRTAVTVPSNASCSSYYSDCSSKCSAWTCNSGYEKSGSSCVKSTPTCSDSGYYGGTSCSNWSSADCMEDYGRMATSATCNPILTNGTCSYCAYDSNPSACYGRCLGSCDVDSWRSCCEQCNGGI